MPTIGRKVKRLERIDEILDKLESRIEQLEQERLGNPVFVDPILESIKEQVQFFLDLRDQVDAEVCHDAAA